MEETKAKILKVLTTVPNGVLYSTTDWHRILREDKREIRRALDDLEAEEKIEIIKSASGRSDKPLQRLKRN